MVTVMVRSGGVRPHRGVIVLHGLHPRLQEYRPLISGLKTITTPAQAGGPFHAPGPLFNEESL